MSLGLVPRDSVSTPDDPPVLQTAPSVALRVNGGGAYDPSRQPEDEEDGLPRSSLDMGARRSTVRRVKVKRRQVDHRTGHSDEQEQDVSHTMHEFDHQQQTLALQQSQQLQRSMALQQMMMNGGGMGEHSYHGPYIPGGPAAAVTPRNVAASMLSLPQAAPTTMQQANAVQNAEQTYKRLGTVLMLIDDMAERMMSERVPKSYKQYKEKRVVVEAEHEEWAPSLALRQSEAIKTNLGILNDFLVKNYVMSAEKRGWFGN